MTQHELISLATGAGYRVSFDEGEGLWYITTPKAFRRPSEELYSWTTEERAWKAAAFLATAFP